MKSRESVVRLKRFQVEEKRRHVEQIDGMVAEFMRMSAELDVQITAEQERTGIRDTAHFAYSTFAKAAIQRRDNLLASAEELRIQREVAQSVLAGAEEELTKLELIVERDLERERHEAGDVRHDGHGRRHSAA
jgi:flagellar export protein FliJ